MLMKKCPKCGKGTYSANRNIEKCVNCGADIKNAKIKVPN